MRDFSVNRNKHTLLEGDVFSLRGGEIVGLVGRNGSGKSSFCHMLLGLTEDPCGQLLLIRDDGVPTSLCRADLRELFYYVFQNPDHQIVGSLVEDDVAFAAENRAVDPSVIKELVDQALLAVGLANQVHANPVFLSGGQKQRLAIAGALVTQARFLILDEPFAMLDPAGRANLLGILRRLSRDRDLGILIVSHSAPELLIFSTIFAIHDNRLLRFDSADDFFSSPVSNHIGFDRLSASL